MLAYLLVQQTCRNWAGKNNSQKNYLCQKISSGALNQSGLCQRGPPVLKKKIYKSTRGKLRGIIQITRPTVGS